MAMPEDIFAKGWWHQVGEEGYKTPTPAVQAKAETSLLSLGTITTLQRVGIKTPLQQSIQPVLLNKVCAACGQMSMATL